jgi:hypothetical protein
MKRFILIFFLLSSCSYSPKENNINLSDINFSDNLSIEEFKIKLEDYANNSSYPNIDN